MDETESMPVNEVAGPERGDLDEPTRGARSQGPQSQEPDSPDDPSPSDDGWVSA